MNLSEQKLYTNEKIKDVEFAKYFLLIQDSFLY